MTDVAWTLFSHSRMNSTRRWSIIALAITGSLISSTYKITSALSYLPRRREGWVDLGGWSIIALAITGSFISSTYKITSALSYLPRRREGWADLGGWPTGILYSLLSPDHLSQAPTRLHYHYQYYYNHCSQFTLLNLPAVDERRLSWPRWLVYYSISYHHITYLKHLQDYISIIIPTAEERRLLPQEQSDSCVGSWAHCVLCSEIDKSPSMVSAVDGKPALQSPQTLSHHGSRWHRTHSAALDLDISPRQAPTETPSA